MTRATERVLNPLMGKSLVVYLVKPDRSDRAGSDLRVGASA